MIFLFSRTDLSPQKYSPIARKTENYYGHRPGHCYHGLQPVRSERTKDEIIAEFNPHELAIEAPFFGKNVQSMLKLGRAQGVAIAVAMQCGLPVTEYSPKKVKQVITGNGNAGKEVPFR